MKDFPGRPNARRALLRGVTGSALRGALRAVPEARSGGYLGGSQCAGDTAKAFMIEWNFFRRAGVGLGR